ncbi:cofilin/actin-depolymerizing factor homolog isoform X1 [Rhipicephalus microplus]|uniref:cofilin/actin-depolymerizing factor homolog isoform X1 n=1 Tax=Rhipicephalus microplus TaxID=6941 RepID=UPI003F6C09A5
MSTGMTFSDEAKAVNEARKTDKKYRYVIYKVVGESVIDAEATGERSAPLENFLEELRPREAGQCRCAVYDYPVTADDGTTTDKTFLITWHAWTRLSAHKRVESQRGSRKQTVGMRADRREKSESLHRDGIAHGLKNGFLTEPTRGNGCCT